MIASHMSHICRLPEQWHGITMFKMGTNMIGLLSNKDGEQ